MRWVAEAVAGALREAGFTEVFTARPAAWAHPEPVVVALAGFERASRQDGEERGDAFVEVHVVRDGADAADADAGAAERALRSSALAGTELGGGRIVAVDTAPALGAETDGSGRSVRTVDVRVTIARSI